MQQPPNLNDFYLMKPSNPLNNVRVQQGTSMWMFFSKTFVTLDGSECNKIGVSYSAFRRESSNTS